MVKYTLGLDLSTALAGVSRIGTEIVDVAHAAPAKLGAGRQPALYRGAIVLRRLRGLALHLEPELRSDALLPPPQPALVEERSPLRAELREPLGRESGSRLQIDDEPERGTGSAHRLAIMRAGPRHRGRRAAARQR